MQKPYARYVLMVFAAVVVLMAGAGMLGQYLLSRQVATSDKVVNVRGVHIVYRLGFIDWFIAGRVKAAERPAIVVLGDSQPYGFGLPNSEIVSARLEAERPAYRVFNLSIQAGHLDDVKAIVARLKANGVRPRYLIASFKPTDFGRAGELRLGSLVLPPAAYFVNLQRLLSLHVFNETPRYGGFADGQFVVYRETRKEDYLVSEDRMKAYISRLKETIEEARSAADHVVMFATAMETGSMAEHYGIDVDAYRRITQAAVAACRETDAICLDLSEAFPRSHFFDLAHLNRTGHRALAQRLAAEIAQTP